MRSLPISYRSCLLAGFLSLVMMPSALPLFAKVRPATDPGDGARNPVEQFAAEWEKKFVVAGYQPVDPLSRSLHSYHLKLFEELGKARAAAPQDIGEAVGIARRKLVEDTARLMEEFVAAGYKRADAELYFDRLFPRAQRELMSLTIIDQASARPAVVREDSSASDQLVAKAMQLAQDTKDYAASIKLLDDALRFAPSNARATLELALTQQKYGQTAAARKSFDLARELYPGIVQLYWNVGRFQALARDYYGAIEACTTAIYLEPRHLEAYALRGQAKLFLDDFQGAIDDFGPLIAAGYRGEGSLERVHVSRGRAHLNLGHLELAQADFEAALRVAPEHAPAHRLLGSVQLRQSNYGAALTALNRALELKPGDAGSLELRIWVRFELGQMEAAIADADRLKRSRPTDAFPHFIQASLGNLEGKWDEAEKNYREAIAIAQTNGETETWCYANFHLDLMRRKRGQNQTDYLNDVLDWPDTWSKRVALYFADKVTGESLLLASQQSTSYLERVNQGCEANYYVGMKLWFAGRRDEALVRLEEAAKPLYAEIMECTFAREFLREARAAKTAASN